MGHFCFLGDTWKTTKKSVLFVGVKCTLFNRVTTSVEVRNVAGVFSGKWTLTRFHYQKRSRQSTFVGISEVLCGGHRGPPSTHKTFFVP